MTRTDDTRVPDDVDLPLTSASARSLASAPGPCQTWPFNRPCSTAPTRRRDCRQQCRGRRRLLIALELHSLRHIANYDRQTMTHSPVTSPVTGASQNPLLHPRLPVTLRPDDEPIKGDPPRASKAHHSTPHFPLFVLEQAPSPIPPLLAGIWPELRRSCRRSGRRLRPPQEPPLVPFELPEPPQSIAPIPEPRRNPVSPPTPLRRRVRVQSRRSLFTGRRRSCVVDRNSNPTAHVAPYRFGF